MKKNNYLINNNKKYNFNNKIKIKDRIFNQIIQLIYLQIKMLIKELKYLKTMKKIKKQLKYNNHYKKKRNKELQWI